MDSKPAVAAHAPQRMRRVKKGDKVDDDGGDGDDDDDGLVEDVVAQMMDDDDDIDIGQETSDDAPCPPSSPLRTRSDVPPPTRSTPGAIRVQASGGGAAGKRNDPGWQEVSGDLEQPREGSTADVSTTTMTTAAMGAAMGALRPIDATEGMISASVVDEEELEAEFQQRKSKMVEATEVRTEDEAIRRQEAAAKAASERRKTIQQRGIVVGAGMLITMTIVIVLAVTLGGKSNKLSDYAYLEELFSPISGENIAVEGTPQYQALNWLAYDDPANLDIQSIGPFNLTQRYVMAVFFYSTGGPTSWVDDLRFLSNYSVCEWPNIEGIEEDSRTDNEIDCNDNGKIVKIRVESNNLTGTIPKELGALTALEILTTGDNENIVGTLPPELGDLDRLNFLQFAGCSLTGTFPETFRKLTSLETFSIYNNNLHGTLPDGFLKESSYNMEIFDVGKNLFTGTIPDAFNTNSPLRYVFMEDNAFEGPIPSTFYSQLDLQILSLSNNQLNGTMGAQIGTMETLRSLYLDGNRMSGSIPTQISSAGELEQIFLNSNDFGGSIPSVIARLTKLKTIDFSNNSFSDLLPSEMGLLKNLNVLNLQSNPDLSGAIPESFAQLNALQKLFLRDIDITGGLNEAFCAKDILITEIQADCVTDREGNLIGTVACDCCTSCCHSGGTECDISVPAICETKTGLFESDLGRGAVCTCSEDGVNVTCSDTTCESCNLEETSCAINQNYGYSLNKTTGEILSFQNTIEYTVGTWAGTKIFYQSFEDGRNCDVWVNGEKCRECSNVICSSGFAGFRILCDSGEVGSVFNSCDDTQDVGPLEILRTYDSAQVSGCPILMERLDNPSGF